MFRYTNNILNLYRLTHFIQSRHGYIFHLKPVLTYCDVSYAAMCQSNFQNAGPVITVYTANDMVQIDVHTL